MQNHSTHSLKLHFTLLRCKTVNIGKFPFFLGVSVGGGPNTISSFAELKLVKNWGLWSKLEISGKSEIVLRV